MKVGGNKNSLNREIGGDGKREWSYGLFDCFSDCPLCAWDRPQYSTHPSHTKPHFPRRLLGHVVLLCRL
jgi:hypothetical protein